MTPKKQIISTQKTRSLLDKDESLLGTSRPRVFTQDSERPFSREELKRVLSINASEKRAADERNTMLNLKRTLETALRNIKDAVEVEYTRYLVLLKTLPEGGFEVLGVVDSDDPPEEEIYWDLALPIPKPETVPEFQGW